MSDEEVKPFGDLLMRNKRVMRRSMKRLGVHDPDVTLCMDVTCYSCGWSAEVEAGESVDVGCDCDGQPDLDLSHYQTD